MFYKSQNYVNFIVKIEKFKKCDFLRKGRMILFDSEEKEVFIDFISF